MQPVQFYQAHLDRVSRSFAFCIEQLSSPLREWVSLSYLLCRILDTIEDAPWRDTRLKSDHFHEFQKFIRSRPSEDEVRRWALSFPNVPPGEEKLLAEALLIFADLNSFSPSVRDAIRETVEGMMAGMRYFSDRSVSGELRLNDFREVNRYCYFVAGVVGELLTRLMALSRTDVKVNSTMLLNAYHFGLFLQKINLLKDQLEDEKNGRFLLPEKERVIESLKKNSAGAISYILSIPVDERGFRVFCAWSLFLGLYSFPYTAGGGGAQALGKIPRTAMLPLLKEIESMVGNDADLLAHFHEAETLITVPAGGKTAASQKSSQMDGAWFEKLALPSLTREDLNALELF